ncbi:MAG: hypothetical protein V3V05_06125 [Pontiella sp.]
MASTYQIKVFGKQGCDKSHTLNQRIEKLLETETYTAFEKIFCDVESIDGLVDLSDASCINPLRIPAMLVAAWDAEAQEYVPLTNLQDSAKEKSKLYPYLGLQTDYSDTGKGVISPKMIQSVLAEVHP